MRLGYRAGLLVADEQHPGLPWFELDSRTGDFTAPGYRYRDTVEALHQAGSDLIDEARSYQKISFAFVDSVTPREHQAQALDAFYEAKGRGVVCLPTGAGKTILAVMIMARLGRSTLVVVPTIDLMGQWQDVLKTRLGVDAGLIGGGHHDISPVSIATYDSAALHAEKLGDKFGLLIYDECHHLPAPQYQLSALASIAPFRLGLSATVERVDGGEEKIYDLLGPLIYEANIQAMVDDVLAPYKVVNVQVPLLDEERRLYDENRKIYTDFLKRNRIIMNNPQAWGEFIRKSSYLPGGSEAMTAYRKQKRIAHGPRSKVLYLWKILRQHSDEAMIIFTDSNDFAYEIGETYLLPVLTHKTKLSERKQFLDMFRSGALKVLVTSKVLNEGVDVPEASVGVVVSGGGSVREHVQRLGRILRHQVGKQAVLYEIVSAGTNETFTNQRRRMHDAYQRPSHTTGRQRADLPG